MSELPAHRKFGFEHMRECEQHRARLILDGYEPDSMALHFAVVSAYEKAHRNDPSYRERVEAWLASQPKSESSALTREEIDYLLDRLTGVNDPIGSSAACKLLRYRAPTNRPVPGEIERKK